MLRQKAKKRSKAPTRRKQPVQARSQRRLETIVEAAAAAFADFGFDATTMEGIAARAGTSIGSVYQFFPNKTAVFREVAQHALEATRATFIALLGPDPTRHAWPDLLDAAIDGFHRQNRESPATRAIMRNLQLYGEYEADDKRQLRDFRVQIAALLSVWAPQIPESRRTVVAAMLVNTIATTMLVATHEEDETLAEEIVEETKVMLRRYIGEYVPED